VIPGPIVYLFVMLQWGRAHVSAETTVTVEQWRLLRSASMGPRSRERGNQIKDRTKRTPYVGFNGAALT